MNFIFSSTGGRAGVQPIDYLTARGVSGKCVSPAAGLDAFAGDRAEEAP